MAIVEGIAYWASITRPNEKFEPMWRVDVALSDKDAEDFKSKGVNLKESVIEDKTVNNLVTFKRKVSKVKVMYKSYDWNYKGKTGTGLDLQAVQVVDLIEYQPREDFNVEKSENGVDIKEDF